MKARTLTVFAAAALVSLAACGGGDEGEGTTGDTTAVETAAPVAPPAVDTSMVAPVPAPMDTTGGAMGDTAGAMGTDTTGGDTTKAP